MRLALLLLVLVAVLPEWRVVTDAKVPSGKWIVNERQVCKNTFGDVIFVMDSSTSIGTSDWNVLLKFVRDVSFSATKRAKKSKGGVHLGFVVFSTAARVEIPLGKQGDLKKLEKNILDTKFTGGVTNTGEALTLAGKEFEKHGRKGKPRTVILITDGESNYGPSYKKAAQDLKEAGINILCVGITDSINDGELIEIASDDSYIFISKFEDMPKFVSKLATKTCETLKERKCNAKADIVLVLDVSSSIHSSGILFLKDFLKRWTSTLAIGANIRVGIVSFGARGYIEFRLKKSVSVGVIQRAILKLKRRKGSNCGSGMKAAYEELRSSRRKHSSKLVIVITDGHWSRGSKKRSFSAALKIRRMGGDIIVVGMTKKPKLDYINHIATKTRLFLGLEYSELSGIVTSFAAKVCHAISYPPQIPKPGDEKYCKKPEIHDQPCEDGKNGIRRMTVGLKIVGSKKCYKVHLRHDIICDARRCPSLPNIKTRCVGGLRVRGKQSYILKEGKCMPEFTNLRAERCKSTAPKPRPPRECRRYQIQMRSRCSRPGTYGVVELRYSFNIKGACYDFIHRARFLCIRPQGKCPAPRGPMKSMCRRGKRMFYIDRYTRQGTFCMPHVEVRSEDCDKNEPELEKPKPPTPPRNVCSPPILITKRCSGNKRVITHGAVYLRQKIGRICFRVTYRYWCYPQLRPNCGSVRRRVYRKGKCVRGRQTNVVITYIRHGNHVCVPKLIVQSVRCQGHRPPKPRPPRPPRGNCSPPLVITKRCIRHKVFVHQGVAYIRKKIGHTCFKVTYKYYCYPQFRPKCRHLRRSIYQKGKCVRGRQTNVVIAYVLHGNHDCVPTLIAQSVRCQGHRPPRPRPPRPPRRNCSPPLVITKRCPRNRRLVTHGVAYIRKKIGHACFKVTYRYWCYPQLRPNCGTVRKRIYQKGKCVRGRQTNVVITYVLHGNHDCVPTLIVQSVRCQGHRPPRPQLPRPSNPPNSCRKVFVFHKQCTSRIHFATYYQIAYVRIGHQCIGIKTIANIVCRRGHTACSRYSGVRQGSSCSHATRRLMIHVRYVNSGYGCIPILTYRFANCKKRHPPKYCGKKQVKVGRCNPYTRRAPYISKTPVIIGGRCRYCVFRSHVNCKPVTHCTRRIVTRQTRSCCRGRYRMLYYYKYTLRQRRCFPRVRFRVRRCSK